jgi:transposase
VAYHEISTMDIWEVIRRWHTGQAIRQIARALGYDRKTVRRYTRLAASLGLSPAKPLPPKEEVLRLVLAVEPTLGRSPQAQTILLPYLEEIVGLVNDPELALKPKSAFHVICERHDLAGKVSYTSFKRFVRTQKPALLPDYSTCRLEALPGSEVQIDYAKVCMLYDPSVGSERTLYVFIATLSHSRLKYVEPTFKQDQTSFVSSHIRMFEFFGGVPERIIIDNLKSGIIKPDLYDPSINRSYREMTEYYGTFVDPARIRHPKDKGKVERDVQTVREALRTQIVLHPDATLGELTQLMKQWSINDYGGRKHGTTHEQPYKVFCERERPALKPLPAERFEVALWKQATVHPDHYIQFQGKAYSIPHAYLGKKVWVRATEHLLRVFYNDRLIKQHLITKAYRHTDHSDFPDNVRAVLDTSATHRLLLERAERLGSDFHQLIRGLLQAHAYLNLRRAQGLVAVAQDYDPLLITRAARFIQEHCLKLSPSQLRHLLEKLQAEQSSERSLPFSDASTEFVRDITYFIKEQEQPQ